MSRTADPTIRISLLSAAEAVFAERGVADAKVEEIARRANVSKGAFYLHFASKEDALRAVVESFLARCSAILPNPCAPGDLPSDAAEMLAFCHARDAEIFELFWQNRAVLAILAQCQGPHEYLMRTFRQDVEKRTQAWIEHLVARGFLRADLDSALVSTLLCGAYHELVHKLVASPKKPPIAEWVRATQDTFVRGLGTPAFAAAAVREEGPRGNNHRDRPVKAARGKA